MDRFNWVLWNRDWNWDWTALAGAMRTDIACIKLEPELFHEYNTRDSSQEESRWVGVGRELEGWDFDRERFHVKLCHRFIFPMPSESMHAKKRKSQIVSANTNFASVVRLPSTHPPKK
ncbi:hypothetical protein VTL71DRAFT_12456 [Oculimacula yallundae]|uniref:Uncharacterized protein n=1 Tax=Oculimacula yallundae TaxID=86028 RepID=A0ABR4CPU1_9HELO